MSIIIPTHDRASFVADAVTSVLDQAVPGVEVIVVDDGSTDDTPRVLDAFGVAIQVVRRENGGPAAARNTGISAATGPVVAFLDSDDLATPGSLAGRLHLLAADPAVDVVIGRSQVLVPAEGAGDPMAWVPSGVPVATRMLGATLVRREALDRVGPFDERMRFGEDEDWFMRADELGLRIARTEMVCQHVRRHGSNMTHDRAGRSTDLLRLVKNRRDRDRAGGGHDIGRSAAEPPREG